MENPNHFILDLFDCDKGTLQSEHQIRYFLMALCTTLGLKREGVPHLVQFRGIDPDDNGFTGSQVLSTSLLSIHTYPKERACYIDLFACSYFDSAMFYAYSTKFFKSKAGWMNRVRREPYISDPNQNPPEY